MGISVAQELILSPCPKIKTQIFYTWHAITRLIEIILKRIYCSGLELAVHVCSCAISDRRRKNSWHGELLSLWVCQFRIDMLF